MKVCDDCKGKFKKDAQVLGCAVSGVGVIHQDRDFFSGVALGTWDDGIEELSSQLTLECP